MRTIYYDLSELFHASAVKFQYYGIARTVMELGYELAQSDADVCFVVFSPAHDRFFEVFPRLGEESPTGICDPNLPLEARPKRLRYSFPEPHMLRDALYPFAKWVVRRMCMQRWQAVPKENVRPVDLNGEILVSLGRPKMMADYLVAMEQAGIRIDFVPLLHDMIPLHMFSHPSDQAFARNFAHDNSIVIKNACLILTNSVFSKSEVLSFSASGHLPEKLPDIVPVPLGHEFRKTGKPKRDLCPQEPYIICVGAMTGRKNLECVVQSLLELHTQGRPVPLLVLAGASRQRTNTYLEKPEFAPIRERIIRYLNPDQAELEALYRGALAFVIASRMEGWGLPLGEAMWLGTPCLASTAAALKEVGGTTAAYFNPDDPAELAALIDGLSIDPTISAEVRQKTLAAKSEMRSWADVASDLVASLKPLR